MPQDQSVGRLELLTSWKEIASFLGKGVRTVQRWEATLGLPVIRPAGSRSGIVMARPADLEAWVRTGHQRSRKRGQQVENAARTVFAECLRNLRRSHVEVHALCLQVNAARLGLQQEIERLKRLCNEWSAVSGPALRDENPPKSAKVN